MGLNTSQLVVETREWSVPGSSTSLVAFLKANPPSGYVLAGYGALGPSQEVTFTRSPASLLDGELICTLQGPLEGTTQTLRVDSEQPWQAPKTAATDIPLDVTGALVRRLDGPGLGASSGREVGAKTARVLAAAINATPLSLSKGRQIPPEATGWAITFGVGAGRAPTARYDDNGTLEVSLSGGATISLYGSAQLDQMVAAIVGSA